MVGQLERRNTLGDADWFRERPSRQYRLRASGSGLVAVRRLANGRFLRVEVTRIPRDADFDNGERLAELAGWRSTYAGVADRLALEKAMKHARRRRP